MKSVVGVMAALLVGHVVAKPVHLSCSTVFEGDPPKEFSVTLDEETGKVTHTFKNGAAFNADGFFTATEVSYKSSKCSSVCITQQFSINRVDLSVTSQTIVSARGVGDAAPVTAKGTCALQAPPPERQF